MLEDKIEEALTFDDVLLLPSYSEVLPGEVDVSTSLTSNIKLNIPLISAAMDTVTEAQTSISMAQEGGIGIIHKNFSIDDQASEVQKVKKYEGGMIINPLTVRPDNKVGDAINIMLTKNITGLPVIRGDNTLLGIVTYRDLRFEKNLDYPVKKIMTKKSKLVTVKEDISLESAKQLLHKYKIEKLPVVNDKFELKGLITMKDIEKIEKHPLACKDKLGRLRCGAAVGVGEDREHRIEALINANCDVIVIDTAHGHSQRVLDAVKSTKKKFPDTELIAGNIATEQGAQALIKAGADCLKIGVGPGSICTTRVIAGIGVPQISAITNVVSRRAPAHHGWSNGPQPLCHAR